MVCVVDADVFSKHNMVVIFNLMQRAQVAGRVRGFGDVPFTDPIPASTIKIAYGARSGKARLKYE